MIRVDALGWCGPIVWEQLLATGQMLAICVGVDPVHPVLTTDKCTVSESLSAYSTDHVLSALTRRHTLQIGESGEGASGSYMITVYR